jgi:hypothetical protein
LQFFDEESQLKEEEEGLTTGMTVYVLSIPYDPYDYMTT